MLALVAGVAVLHGAFVWRFAVDGCVTVVVVGTEEKSSTSSMSPDPRHCRCPMIAIAEPYPSQPGPNRSSKLWNCGTRSSAEASSASLLSGAGERQVAGEGMAVNLGVVAVIVVLVPGVVGNSSSNTAHPPSVHDSEITASSHRR